MHSDRHAPPQGGDELSVITKIELETRVRGWGRLKIRTRIWKIEYEVRLPREKHYYRAEAPERSLDQQLLYHLAQGSVDPRQISKLKVNCMLRFAGGDGASPKSRWKAGQPSIWIPNIYVCSNPPVVDVPLADWLESIHQEKGGGRWHNFYSRWNTSY